MKNKQILYFSFCLLLITSLLSCTRKEKPNPGEETSANEWFINQRIFPYATPDYNAYKKAVVMMHQEKASMRTTVQGTWSYAGPENLGGRVVDVELPGTSTSTIYVCAASGGIFKTTNNGSTWKPIFDDNPSLSIGDLAIAPSDSNILYCGTGEANAGGGSVTYDGAGIFKSSNGGATWNYTGLDSTRNIGRIAIHPTNPRTVFAATMGDLFGKGPDRGLYRTLDGGATWKKVLYLNDSTGAIDVVINPLHPDTIYACMWTRIRRANGRTFGSPASGIYRSYDGGDTWAKLTKGMPAASLGRIGIDISRSNPDILYATVTNSIGADPVIIKTTDNGYTWNDVSSNFSSSGYSFWFSKIKIDPQNPNVVYEMDLDLWKTTNGGGSWNVISNSIHVDHHALYINPGNSNLLYLGNDGGFYKSTSGGSLWSKTKNLPIMQFYTCEVDEQQPSLLYGGAQDNGVNTTPSGGVTDWYSVWGGDGFVVLVDPTNSSRVYAESQYGGLNVSTTGINGNDRTNWNTPFVFNPRNAKSLYLGTSRIYKTLNRGNSWSAISPDLTKGIGSAAYPDAYATITAIGVAASDTNVIYAGTDDGNVQVTTNGGSTWNLISSSLPLRWVTHLEVDPRNALQVWVTLSGYRYHDKMSHIYYTENGGTTWTAAGGNLPDVPVNDVIIDTTFETLYLATDIGVYSSAKGSTNWQLLGTGLPLVAVTDLRLHYSTHTLVAATYGRSMYTFDLNVLTPVAELPSHATFSIHILQNPVRDQLMLNTYTPKPIATDMSLFDLSGKKVLTRQLRFEKGSSTAEIPLPALAPGVYIMSMTAGSMQSIAKIYIQHP